MLFKRIMLTTAFAIGLSAPMASAESHGGTLDKIASSGEIVLGYRESSVPFSYLDENQQPIGYSIDLCMKIVDAVAAELDKELTVRYVPVNPKTRIAHQQPDTSAAGRISAGDLRDRHENPDPQGFRHQLGGRSGRQVHRAGAGNDQ